MKNSGNHFGQGLRACGPKSNLQRQREFVARNPHYYRDRRRREKARYKAHQAAQQAEAERSRLLLEAPLFTEVIHKELAQTPQALASPAKRLALPAPEPVVMIQLPLFIPVPVDRVADERFG